MNGLFKFKLFQEVSKTHAKLVKTSKCRGCVFAAPGTLEDICHAVPIFSIQGTCTECIVSDFQAGPRSIGGILSKSTSFIGCTGCWATAAEFDNFL